MEEFLKYNELFDCYSNLLTEKEREVFSLYYKEDLSLQEIADMNNVSRSAIQKTIKTSLEKLDFYEESIGYCNLIKKLKELNNHDVDNLLEKL